MVTPFLVSCCFPLEPNNGSPPAFLLVSPLFVVGSICFRYERRWLRHVGPRSIWRSFPPFPLTRSEPVCWSRSATRNAQASETVIPVSKSTQRRAWSRRVVRFAPGAFPFQGKPFRIAWSKVADETKRGRGTVVRGNACSLIGEHESVPCSTSQRQNARAERA